MNIFVLDESPMLAAEYHNDKHVVKMILESVQILSTVRRKYGLDAPYKPTHANHPCTLWTGESSANYQWLWDLAFWLGQEYTRRYGRMHKSATLLSSVYDCEPIPKGRLTPFAQAMPDQYKHPNPVKAYRNYYLGEKREMSRWTNRATPVWFVAAPT